MFEPPERTDSGYGGRVAAKSGGGGGGRADGQALLKRSQRVDETLHLSWEAEKKLEESVVIIPPAGKKIVF